MATRTNRAQLNLGAPFDPVAAQGEEGQAWRNAFYTVYIGVADTSPALFGDYLARYASTVTGATVTSDEHEAVLPGPVISVQATTATSAGVKSIRVTGTPIAGQALVTTDPVTGRDTIEFAAADAVTVCAYRQVAMPTEIADGLAADTDPPIEV